jgi:hypothetical protein
MTRYGTRARRRIVDLPDLYAPGGDDVAIADGGTGASDAATAFANLKQAATDSVTGVVEKATPAEVEAATADKYPDAALLKYHPGVAKAWVQFNGTGTVAIRASYNVSSVTDNGTGDYTINFTTAFSSANYGFQLSAAESLTGAGFAWLRTDAPTIGAFRLITTNFTGTLTDCQYVSAVFFGDQ